MSVDVPPIAKRAHSKLLLFVAVALVIGAALRFWFPLEIEYQFDEAYMFERAVKIGRSEPWPSLGMPSSRLIRNPAPSMWAFVGLARLFAVETPVGLAVAVECVNVLALVLLVVVALRFVKEEKNQRAWLLATAFASVNVFLVIIERKIWAQSILPLLSVFLLMGWFRRSTFLGAVAWGFFMLVAAEVHMAGFFFAPALVVTAFLFDRKGTHWKGWFLGSLLAALPLIPWIQHVLTHRGGRRMSHDYAFEFYQYWVLDPSGLGSDYMLREDYFDFWRYPLVAGRPSYLTGAVHVGLLVTMLTLAAYLVRNLWARRSEKLGLIIAKESDTDLLLTATLVGMGGLMTLTTMPMWRHYMMMTFPLQYVWICRLALRVKKERLLALLIAGNLAVTVLLRAYLHDHGGARPRDQGRSYRLQLERGEVFKAPIPSE